MSNNSSDYELLDSGEGERLERWGNIILSRPDPGALYPKRHRREWEKANASYIREGEKGSWHVHTTLPTEWPIRFCDFSFMIRPTSFKHTGLFPEQKLQWQFISERIKNAGREVSILNLFAYTGGSSLAALKAGARVTHVDASKKAVLWAKENAALSGLSEKPTRWIIDDALTFLKREVKRGNRYEGIILDPPSFGHGPNDELWKIERDFLPLMDLVNLLLSDTPLFVLLNGYAEGYSPLAFAHNLIPIQKKYGGTIEHGEHTILESGPGGRLLPSGIFARWKKD